jgi:hypothetical protein
MCKECLPKQIYSLRPSAFTFVLVISAIVFLSYQGANAESAQDCFYKDKQGVIKVSDGIDKIPAEYRASAQCTKAKTTESVRPNQIQLEGNTRSVDMASPLGRIELRWPRTLEKIFSRTPERAVADAARTASRALKSGGFPTHLTTLDMSWRIVFLDQNLPETQIPAQVVSNCHPGWMYPPADIFIVAQRVAAGCVAGDAVSPEKADSALTRVLLHEMGHAIEFALMKGEGAHDPLRAEGFASWFEGFSAHYSSLVDDQVVLDEYRALGLSALEQGNRGFSFSGSPTDYGLGALYFRLLQQKRGVAGIVSLYQKRLNQGAGLVQSLHDDFAWGDERWIKEIRDLR